MIPDQAAGPCDAGQLIGHGQALQPQAPPHTAMGKFPTVLHWGQPAGKFLFSVCKQTVRRSQVRIAFAYLAQNTPVYTGV